MPSYNLTIKAKQDLVEIWEFTFEKWSKNQADKYYNLLIHQFNLLAENPYLGKNYRIIKDGYLGFPLKSHIIFYKISTGNKILIIRILHKRMDLSTRLKT